MEGVGEREGVTEGVLEGVGEREGVAEGVGLFEGVAEGDAVWLPATGSCARSTRASRALRRAIGARAGAAKLAARLKRRAGSGPGNQVDLRLVAWWAGGPQGMGKCPSLYFFLECFRGKESKDKKRHKWHEG